MALILAAFLLVQAALTAPETFFVGRTEGVGSVRVIMSGRHGVRVQSRGRMENGALIIEQTVHEEGKTPAPRRWRLVRTGPNHFTGTLSAARGPVTGTVEGNVLHLRYRSVEGPAVEQWITIQPGGRTARNRMIYRRLGVTVATVEETIRRID